MTATTTTDRVRWAGLYREYRGCRLDIRRQGCASCATAYGYYLPDGPYRAVEPRVCVDEDAAVNYLVDCIDAALPPSS